MLDGPSEFFPFLCDRKSKVFQDFLFKEQVRVREFFNFTTNEFDIRFDLEILPKIKNFSETAGLQRYKTSNHLTTGSVKAAKSSINYLKIYYRSGSHDFGPEILSSEYSSASGESTK